MKHFATATNGDSLCWEWTVNVNQEKYGCCENCEKNWCYFCSIFHGEPTCKPKMNKIIKEKKRKSLLICTRKKPLKPLSIKMFQ